MWRLLFGPTLHAAMRGRVHQSDEDNMLAIKKLQYKANFLESRAQRLVSVTRHALRFGFKIAPVVLLYCVLWRGWTSVDDLTWVAQRMAFFSIGLALANACGVVVRALGRARNPAYLAFLDALAAKDASLAKLIHEYDFDFSHVPARHVSTKSWRPPTETATASLVGRVQGLLTDGLCWCIAHGFARHIIYPGAIVGSFMADSLLLGRLQLVGYRGFQRVKIATASGMEIDSVYVDRRGRSAKGQTLVLVCQGNCGFYEVAMMDQPFCNGYSVFGWNHPGFGHSTGTCSDAAEIESMSALLDFILNELKWREEDIILYGWSIGGFSAATAASICPRVRGLILDATFADLLPLARAAMPPALEPIVQRVIARHFDLDVLRHARDYAGPVLLIKRLHDEIMASGGRHRSCTDLLVEGFLQHRFPAIFSGAGMRELRNLLSGTPTVAARPPGNLRDAGLDEHSRTRWAAYIASRYVRVLATGHNEPLPVIPDIFSELPDSL